jgi:3-hydroxybutyryl-CoA dehydratase
MLLQQHKNEPKGFDSVSINESVKFYTKITEKLHSDFAKLSGDYSPIHANSDFCEKTLFKQKIGYGFLLTSFLSKLYGEYLPGGNSICIKQEIFFVNPFFINDTITVHGTIIKKIESVKFLEIEVEMFRNQNECVLKGIGTVKII